MSDPRFSLSWDTYQKNICNGLGLLQQKGEFVDMTISADGHQVKVHQMVMSLVSPYIKELITSAQCSHPIIFLNRVSYQTLQSILEYAYTGEVLVSRDILHEFLETCKSLHIKGLENKNVTTPDGALLGLLDDKETQELLNEPGQKQACTEEQPTQTVINSRMTDDDSDENDGYIIEESHMDESGLDNDVVNYETIGFDDRADVSVEAEELLERKPSLRSRKAYSPSDEQSSSFPMENYNLAASRIQYSLSNQGSIQISLNRYLYRLRHTRKNKERMWRCSDYKKGCQAYAITRGDTIIERGCAHNHPFHDKQILKRLRSGNMYSAFNIIQDVVLNKKQASTIKSEDKTQWSNDNKYILYD